jgi:hypothetical protein
VFEDRGMQDFNLNVGGVVGAIGCLGIVVALAFAVRSPLPFGPLLVPLAVAGGAYAGNYLWKLVIGKPK